MKIDWMLEEAYKVFSGYRVGIHLDVCKCNVCLSDYEESYLTTTPLRNLDFEFLCAYINSARVDTPQEQYEMRYFMPRILEMITQDKFPDFGVEEMFGRLFDRGTGVFGGTDYELSFLEDFFREYWLRYMNGYVTKESIDTIFQMIGNYFNVELLFKEWKGCNSVSSILHLSDLIIYLFGRANNYFSKPELYQKILDWLDDDKIRNHFLQKLENIYCESSGLDDEALFNIEVAFTLYSSWKP